MTPNELPSTQKVLITAALLYANGTLHFGHLAGAYLAADCYARFQRQLGNDVLFVSGSDEYGVAITLSAEMEGRTPQAHIDHYHPLNKTLFERLNFSFDHYARTTWPGHRKAVEEYFLDLLENGYIEVRRTLHLYCEAEGRFLADRYVAGTCPRCRFPKARGDECPKCAASFEATDLIEPRSRLSGAALTKRESTHWFLCLDKLAAPLREWLATRQWKPSVLNFLEHYVDNLQARAITRDADWGIPVPLEEAKGKVFYVWFEALIGYISASIEWAQQKGSPDRWRDFWCDPKTRLVHFIGKDNIFFHGLFFPAMTLGQNQPYKLVDDLPANEFLKLEGKQFSKTEGWMIDLADFLERYSADQIRYTLAANAPETSDSAFTWSDFQKRCNSELLGKYGNLVNRTLVFAQRFCEGKIPPMSLTAEDQAFRQKVNQLTGQIADAYAGYHLRLACQLIMELAAAGNGYFNEQQPWVWAKEPDGKARVETTIHCCLECLKVLATVSSPVIPDTASRVWALLGFKVPLERMLWKQALAEPLPIGSPLPIPEVLFERISDEAIQAELAKLKGRA